MITQIQRRFVQAQIFLSDTRGELDEKALLITFFVLIAMVGLTTLGNAVSGQFDNLAGLV
jgi:hypothetical protein